MLRSRFAVVENTVDIIEKQKNASTRRITDGHMKLLKKFLLSVFENHESEQIKTEKLDKRIAQFILSVRKSFHHMTMTYNMSQTFSLLYIRPFTDI